MLRQPSGRADVAGRPEARQPVWRLALNLSMTAAVGGVLFVLVGAFLAAWITFGFGAVCAVIAGLLVRHDHHHHHHSARPH